MPEREGPFRIKLRHRRSMSGLREGGTWLKVRRTSLRSAAPPPGRRPSLRPAGDSEPTRGAFGIGLQKHLLPVHLGQLQYHHDRPHGWWVGALPGDDNRGELFVAGHDACDVTLGVRSKAD